MLIAIEGVDGAGKTTQAARLAEALNAHLVREPGGTKLGERVRDLLLDASSDDAPTPRAEALLYAAARAQLVERVLAPLLDAGGTVVCDRFLGSTLAYQGGGRGLDPAALRRISLFATGGRVPDRTILLSIDPRAAAMRRGSETPDRMEDEGLAFQQRVARTYATLASDDPTWRVVPATGTPDEVFARVRAAAG